MRCAVIGAGAAGLAAAYDLTRAGHTVDVYEAADSVGGLAAGFRAGGWEWPLERYYHHWFASDRSVLGLIAELGWSDDVVFRRPLTVIWDGTGFRPFDSPATVLGYCLRRFPPLDVARFAAALLYLRTTRRWQPLERVTAGEWMSRHCGERIYQAVWRPLLVSKFGAEAERVNMAWMWARIKARTTRLGTFRGGFQAFLERLADVARKQGAEILLERPVRAVRSAADRRLEVETAAGRQAYDAVVATTSPGLFARIAGGVLPEDYSTRLLELRSHGAVALVLALDRPLTRAYWHNLPKDAGFPFLALVEHTNLVPAEHYGGDHLVYCGDYLPADHEHFRLTKDQLLERFLPALARFNPAFDRSWVRDSWLWRTPYAQPIPYVDHSRRLPELATGVPGLFLASMSQVYPWDRGTNFAVELGRRVARMVIAGGRHGRPPCRRG